MHSRLIWTAPVMLALAACATGRLADEVKPYVGRNVDELASRIGKPHGQLETTGNRVFVWSSDTEGAVPTRPDEGVNTRPLTEEFTCTLEVTVNAQNLIQSYQIDGSNAGCNALRRQINR